MPTFGTARKSIAMNNANKKPQGRLNEAHHRVFLPWSQKTAGEMWSEVIKWVIFLPCFYLMLAFCMDLVFGIELPIPE